MRQWQRAGDVDATLVFLLKHDVGRFFVDTDSESFQLRFDDTLVCQRLVDVQDDEDEMACLGHGNHLTASTLAILGSLDDARKVKHLDLGTIVNDLTRNGGQLVPLSTMYAPPSYV